jgi:hypothetical protein
MTTDAYKQEHIQHKFVALCFSNFFPRIPYNYTYAVEQKLCTLQITRHCLDALVFIHAFLG